jgi:hypothetical protein
MGSESSGEDHCVGVAAEGGRGEDGEDIKASGEVEIEEKEESRDEDHATPLPSSSSHQQIPFETMDSLLMICLLRTLKYLIKDKDFPMLTSAFWSIVTRSEIFALPSDLLDSSLGPSSQPTPPSFPKIAKLPNSKLTSSTLRTRKLWPS